MAVQLTLTGDLNLTREITFTQAGKIIAFIGSEEGSDVTSRGSDQIVALEPGAQKPDRQSLRELIDEAGASTNPQKIVVLGNYIAQGSQESAFSSESIKSLFPKAGEKAPKNFTRDIQAAANNGWIEELPNQTGVYFVTRAGEDKASAGFSASTRPKQARTKHSNPSKSPTQLTIRDEISSIPIFTPELEGYPNYHKLRTKGARVMWILAFAQAHDLEALRPNEIAFIAGRLRDKIDPRDINGLTLTAARNGWLAKDSNAFYTLLHKGDEQVKSSPNDDKTS